MYIQRFFKDAIYLFSCQGHLKQFIGNYQFRQKSGNDAYSRGLGGHVICVIMTHRAQKSIYDISLMVPKKKAYTVFTKSDIILQLNSSKIR